jgi:hypothetical protein
MAASVKGGQAVGFANCSFSHLGGGALAFSGGTGHSLRRSAARCVGNICRAPLAEESACSQE